MKKSVLSKQIPTYLGLLLLGATAIIAVFISRSTVLFPTRATTSVTPSSIHISNISDSSFVVSYVTSEKTTGSISYGETVTAGSVANDDRDIQGTRESHQLHYFTVKNLKPVTNYYFTILSGGSTFDNQGTPFTLITGQTISSEPLTNGKVVNGSVQLPSGSIPQEAVAYITVGDSQVLSTPVQKDGSFHFNLDLLRSQGLNNLAQLNDTDQVQLTVFGDGYNAEAAIALKNAATMPSVTLSQQYSFTAENPQTITTENNASSSAETTPALLPTFPSEEKTADGPAITIPKNNQEFTDQQPEFKGSAIPNKAVTIVIESETQIKTTVNADASGKWSYRPDQKLTPGIHTITISSPDASGVLRSITSSFIVYAEGSHFTDPSVPPTKAPTQAPTVKPTTITPTAIPSASPTIPAATPSAALSPFPSPTIQPSPTVPVNWTTIIITPHPTIDQTGSNDLILTAGILATIGIISTFLFFLLGI